MSPGCDEALCGRSAPRPGTGPSWPGDISVHGCMKKPGFTAQVRAVEREVHDGVAVLQRAVGGEDRAGPRERKRFGRYQVVSEIIDGLPS